MTFTLAQLVTRSMSGTKGAPETVDLLTSRASSRSFLFQMSNFSCTLFRICFGATLERLSEMGVIQE